MNRTVVRRLVRVWLLLVFAVCEDIAEARQAAPSAHVKVYLDCEDCFADFLRTEVTFVDYVRDRAEATVHALISRAETAGGGREYTLALIGLGPYQGADHSVKTVTTAGDPEDVVRRQLANTLRVALLRYVTAAGVPQDLSVSVRLGAEGGRAAPAADRWNQWVYSLRGSAEFNGEESSKERNVGLDLSADRITADWKLSLGVSLEQERETFDLDEDEPVKAERRERDFEWLVVKALGDHWSIGAEGDVESSTFDNIRLSFGAAPAIEYNLFPYSMYTRRQLRALYAVGVQERRYYEATLLGRTRETLPQHQISLTFEQREPWGSLEARTEWSQFLHDVSKTRLEVEGRVGLRLARGFSIEAELSASRVRDQISLPARGATPEEVLLRLRQLRSGYEYNSSISLTYTFGSIFSSLVNPRFGS